MGNTDVFAVCSKEQRLSLKRQCVKAFTVLTGELLWIGTSWPPGRVCDCGGNAVGQNRFIHSSKK